MKLTGFPNEILYSIFSHIQLKSDLIDLMLVSPSIKALAALFLYS